MCGSGVDRTFTRAQTPNGEAWVASAIRRIEGGPHAGQPLQDLLNKFPEWLLGTRGAPNHAIPLLIKLLDCQDWLSVQVHPKDEDTLQLHGSGHVDKTEVWHILHAASGAQSRLALRQTPCGAVCAVVRSRPASTIRRCSRATPC